MALAELCLHFNISLIPKYSLNDARKVDNMHTLNNLDDDVLTSSNQIPAYIFNKLMIADYQVREIRLSQTSDSEIFFNPMDALLGIFHCSDNLLRQYLAVKLSSCQLSVPFLLPDPDSPSQNVTMLLSALESITKTWKVSSNNSRTVHEVFATEHPFPLVSFIRIGETGDGESKSCLINKVMSDERNFHNFFFHKEMNGGNVRSKVIDGLVELTWYLPGGQRRPIFQDGICFLNLRGDAGHFKKQLDFLLKISSVLCVVLPSQYPDKVTMKVLNKVIEGEVAKVILIFPKTMKQDEEEKTKEYFKSLTSAHKLSLIMCSTEPTFLSTIRKDIQENIQNLRTRPLVDFLGDAGDYGISVDVDQLNGAFGTAVDKWLRLGIKEAKRRLKLQTHIPVLAKLEREMYCPKRHGNKSIETDDDDIYRRIDENQGSLSDLDRETLDCLNNIAKMDKFERNLSLNKLKHQLDKMSLQLKTHSRQNNQREKMKNRVKSNWKPSEKFSFGLEHIMREFSQLYQIEESKYDYAGAAADMLLSGQPLEILDGDSFYIPLDWFNEVYRKLESKTQNANIFVISVVGIQSSGKSTLLNTMFGLDFPVSAGRCTRGVFASLIPVSDSLRSDSGFHYLLIVDTEGLRGSGDPQIREHDNELVTFVISVADACIVNIMGEIHTEMNEFLGIAVCAFLKMKLAEENKKTSCRIVHQNVTAIDADDVLDEYRWQLMQDLDEMTVIAASQENSEEEKFEKFNDVILFNEDEDVFYLPGLFLGNPPLAPINPEYGSGVQKIKNSIITLMCSKTSQCHSVADFRDRVKNVWQAIQKEDFIFTLQNASEARARTSLEKTYLENNLTIIFKEMEELKARIDVALRKCSKRDEREKIWAEKESEILEKAEKVRNEMEKAMDYFFETNDDKAILAKWREEIKIKIRAETEIQAIKVREHCLKTLFYLREVQDIEEKQISYEEKLLEKAKAVITKVQHLDKRNLSDIFEKEWKEWIKFVPESKETKIDINGEMLSFICEKDSGLFKEILRKKGDILAFKYKHDAFHYHLIFTRKKFMRFLYVFFIFQHLNYLSARRIKRNAVEKALEFARNASESGVRFSRNHLEKMYQIVFTTINTETEKCSFKFENSFKYEILLYTFANSYMLFDEMEQRFLDKHDIRGNLEKNLRPKLLNYFINVCQKETQVLAASLFVDVLRRQIESWLNSRMGPALAPEITRRHTRIQFHAETLIKLGEKKEKKEKPDFKPYKDYFEDPFGFLRKKFEESIENYCLENEVMSKHIKSTFKEKVDEIKSEITAAFDKANERTPTNGKKLTFWIREFVNECKTLHVKENMFGVLTIKDLEEINDFQNNVRDGVTELLGSLIPDKVTRATLRKWDPPAHKSAFDQMFSCQSTCPLCYALCDSDVNGNHSTKYHRPMGLIGIKHKNTEKLERKHCVECVAENTETVSWNITGNKTSIYWKWFMATFWKELAEEHEAEEDRPFFWRFISFKRVKRQLMLDSNL